MEKDKAIEKEDYEEPRCLLNMDEAKKDRPIFAVPVGRVLDKADEYFSRNDYEGAERHFLYWLKEAKEGGDLRGEFALRNELMGLYRKRGKKEKAYENVERAVALIDEIGLGGGISAGTAFVNAGTVYKSFGEPEKALPFYEKALKIYDKELSGDDGRKGALYNNEALCLCDLKRFAEAREKYRLAVKVMEKVKGGELEIAITYLNLADLIAAEKGLEEGAEEISELIERAWFLLDTAEVENKGYYAFVCEKCAPTFGYYGYFAYEGELKERSRAIYERD
ncbi:MAG: tetratricopeptide repeat protein [Clostridia bacterium]|nr:tetratricopeptide repeat protein [Clostridia bacterium]